MSISGFNRPLPRVPMEPSKAPPDIESMLPKDIVKYAEKISDIEEAIRKELSKPSPLPNSGFGPLTPLSQQQMIDLNLQFNRQVQMQRA